MFGPNFRQKKKKNVSCPCKYVPALFRLKQNTHKKKRSTVWDWMGPLGRLRLLFAAQTRGSKRGGRAGLSPRRSLLSELLKPHFRVRSREDWCGGNNALTFQTGAVTAHALFGLYTLMVLLNNSAACQRWWQRPSAGLLKGLTVRWALI